MTECIMLIIGVAYMKKIQIFGLIISLVCIVLLCFCIFNISKNQQTHSKKIDNVNIITHNINNKNIEVYLTNNIKKVSDNVFIYEIIVNQSENISYYINNINLSITFDNSIYVISGFYSVGDGTYYKIDISYKNDLKNITCFSKNDYLYVYLIMECDSNPFLLDNKAIDLQYDIFGRFPYSFNRFKSIKPLLIE